MAIYANTDWIESLTPLIKRIVIISLLSVSPLSQATVYKWQDKEGITHYANQPYEGASELSLLPTEAFNNPAVSQNGVLNRSVRDGAEMKKLRQLKKETRQKNKKAKNRNRDK